MTVPKGTETSKTSTGSDTFIWDGVGLGVPPTTGMQAENSEVLPNGSIAVAVIECPLNVAATVAVKGALQSEFVVTTVVPR